MLYTMLSGKCKLKQDATTNLSGWLKYRTLTILSVEKEAEQQEILSLLVEGKRYSYFGREFEDSYKPNHSCHMTEQSHSLIFIQKR